MISPIVAAGTFAAGFLLGALPPSLSAIVARWGRAVGWDAAQCDRHLRRAFVWPLVVLLPAAGWIGDMWGAKDATFVGLIALVVALTLLASIPQARTATANMLGLAVGVAFLAVGIIAWMPTLLGSPGRAVETLNLGFVAISLGWLFGSSAIDKTLQLLGLTGALLAGAGLAAASLLLLSSSVDVAAVPGPRQLGVYRDLYFWMLLAAALLYFPVESCLEIWSGPFLRDLGDRRYLRSRIFGFWCVYLLARLATFGLVRTGFEPWFLLACAAVSAMVLGNLVGAYGPSSGGFGFWLVGFCYGPLLPGFLGLFGEAFPDRFGVLLGSLLALGTIYRTALGPVLHRYALRHSPREAMRVPAVLTLLLAAPLLLVTLLR